MRQKVSPLEITWQFKSIVQYFSIGFINAFQYYQYLSIMFVLVNVQEIASYASRNSP